VTLFVFALNTDVGVTVTDLTRARGEISGLPPLAEWLGVEALDTDRIELFPVADLGGLPLSGYLVNAHDAEPSGQAARLDALAGSVLIVPQAAMTGMPSPGAHATLIATLPMARADHRATLDPAPIPKPSTNTKDTPAASPAQPLRWVVAGAFLLAALFVWWLT